MGRTPIPYKEDKDKDKDPSTVELVTCWVGAPPATLIQQSPSSLLEGEGLSPESDRLPLPLGGAVSGRGWFLFE